MTTGSAIQSQDLAWCFPDAGQKAFVLRAAGAAVGWLQFEAKAGARSTAGFDGSWWTFEQASGLHPNLTIRAGASDEFVAEYVPHLTGGGVVSFASGARYCWTRQSIWSDRWCFRCKRDKSAVCVSQEVERLMDGGKVQICPDAALLPEAPILVLLAWYLRVFDFDRLGQNITLCG